MNILNNPLINFPIGFGTEDLSSQAKEIAVQYTLTLDQQTLPRLQLTNRGLVLLIDKFSPLAVDFSSLLTQRRLDKTHGLIRACKPTVGMTILDVTAGWGRDAGLLAQHGAQVIMLERQPVMAALLADGLRRLPPNTLALSCIHQDALLYLSQLEPSDYPDVIYIDPMHPERNKSALVKKDMQALQQLFGPDLDAHDLLNLAVTRVKKRVVLKWPQRLTPLIKPDSSIPGKTVRFDVYIPQK
jgi:16S rRNA (guanine1516-N2)-methyltransferase